MIWKKFSISTELSGNEFIRLSYSWVDEVPPLQGAFQLEDYKAASEGCGIAGAVFMEVDIADGEIAEEVKWVQELADRDGSGILGIIAAARPEADGFEAHLDSVSVPLLRGVRRVLHTQADALSRSRGFRTNLRRLTACSQMRRFSGSRGAKR